jgi:acetate kinase
VNILVPAEYKPGIIMNILVLNSGSSSVKYQMIDPQKKLTLARGVVERIGMAGAMLTHKPYDREEIRLSGEILDHKVAIEYVLSILLSKNHGVIKDKSEIDAVGHRVVHGGESFSESVMISSEVIKEISRCMDYAPLHNPPNLKGIRATQALLPDAPQVCVFDTAFHQTMPDYAYMYGLPYVLYKRHGIRRYGFHGTSHFYVSDRLAELCGRPLEKLKVVTCHLGNGCSVTAIQHGQSIDTSMGFTPLEGLLMGTRSGDLDPAVVLHIMNKEELSMHEANTMLNKHSGIQGLSGLSSDMREIEEEYDENNRARLAHHIFCYRITKYIGAYAAAMGGLDAIVFTGGIGENSSLVRQNVLKNLSFLGIEIDDKKNQEQQHDERILSSDQSDVMVWVIPTNEELVIALDRKLIQ